MKKKKKQTSKPDKTEFRRLEGSQGDTYMEIKTPYLMTSVEFVKDLRGT